MSTVHSQAGNGLGGFHSVQITKAIFGEDSLDQIATIATRLSRLQIATLASDPTGTTLSDIPAPYAELAVFGTSSLFVNANGTWSAASGGGGGGLESISSLAPAIIVGSASTIVDTAPAQTSESVNIFGVSNTVTGQGLALGYANDVGDGAVAVGNELVAATASFVGGIGGSAGAAGVAIGPSAFADIDAVGIGSATSATSLSVSLGKGALALSTQSIGIGNGSMVDVSAPGAIAIGGAADIATGASLSVAIGAGTSANGVNSVAIGPGLTGYAATATIQIGQVHNQSGTAPMDNNIVIGSSLTLDTAAVRGVLIGHRSTVTGNDAVTIGYLCASQPLGVAVGRSAVAQSNGAAVGFNDIARTNSVAIGSTVRSGVSGVAIGSSVNAEGLRCIAIGNSISCASQDGIAIG